MPPEPAKGLPHCLPRRAVIPAVILLSGLGAGCPDAIREGALSGAAGVAETGVASGLGFYTAVLEASLAAFQQFLAGLAGTG
jgi:hypothetical protein